MRTFIFLCLFASWLRAADLPALPEAVTSFGAVVLDDWLYVYGGHKAGSHSWSLATTSGRFHRLNLNRPERWEELAGGPPMQSPGLAAHAGRIYLVGGMQPQNPTEKEKSVLKSQTHAAVFDPSKNLWSKLPDLPEPRSSHDIAVLDGRLHVAGGWSLDTSTDTGEADDKNRRRPYHTTVLMLDLAAPSSGWKSFPQPFQRRALAVVARQGNLYCLGGMTGKNEICATAHAYAAATRTWTELPELAPAAKMKAFGTAACVLDDQIIASPGGGKVYALDADHKEWREVAQLKTSRYFHQLEAWRNHQLIALGGTKGGEPLDSVEVVGIQAPSPGGGR